jgi:lipoprotein-anchoring transpeptidase ErfK/SrfK
MRRTWWALLAAPAMGIALASTLTATASAATTARQAPAAAGQLVRLGMSGSTVKSLQRRLAQLKYYPGSIDGQFGASTLEAVWAFQEVQGLPGEDYVSSAMRRALAHPKAPRVLEPRGGSLRVEVNLSREVLVLYNHNRVELISHVSTGGHYYYCSNGGCAYAVTPTGNFRTTVYMPGWVTVPLGEMYNPVFFIGTAFAIHGDTDVPLQPASHGCVRIPMDIAAFFHTLVRTPGTPVYVRY